MDLEEIKKLIALLDESNLSEIEVEDAEQRILLKRELSPPPVVQGLAVETQSVPVRPPAETEKEVDEEADSSLHQVTSPIVGTFYRSSSPDVSPYIELGDLVKKGQTLCIVEAMKLMNEIESDVVGKVVKVNVSDGSAVEFGEVLFTIEPA